MAKVIAEARERNAALGRYLWLVVVTGVRRGELCCLQIGDVDLDRGGATTLRHYADPVPEVDRRRRLPRPADRESHAVISSALIWPGPPRLAVPCRRLGPVVDWAGG